MLSASESCDSLGVDSTRDETLQPVPLFDLATIGSRDQPRKLSATRANTSEGFPFLTGLSMAEPAKCSCGSLVNRTLGAVALPLAVSNRAGH